MESDTGKLFIGGISWDTDEERLRNHFERYGDVVEAIIMKDRTTGRARGFGFVVFADPAVVESVLMEKHNIDGRMVEAKRAVPRDDNRSNGSTHGSPGPARTKKIFAGGLAPTVTENDLQRYFDKFGTITDVVVMYDHNTQRPRGFGFITFDSEDAVDKVLLKKFHELNGKLVEVKKAVPRELSPGPTVRSPIAAYNSDLNRLYNFADSFAQGLNLNTMGGYGMRMDGGIGPIAGEHRNFPLLGSNNYGAGKNFEFGMNPNWGRNMNHNYNLGNGRLLNPYYGGSPRRYDFPMGYGGGNSCVGQRFVSPVRTLLDDGSLNYTSNLSGCSTFPISGSANFCKFGSSGLQFGHSTSAALADACGNMLGYRKVGIGYEYCENGNGNSDGGFGNSENGYGIRGCSIGTNSVNGHSDTSLLPTASPYDGAYPDLYSSASRHGDSTWCSIHKELDSFGSFAHEFADAATTVMDKDFSDSLDSYGATDRQKNML